jgi:hypothetical protein
LAHAPQPSPIDTIGRNPLKLYNVVQVLIRISSEFDSFDDVPDEVGLLADVAHVEP